VTRGVEISVSVVADSEKRHVGFGDSVSMEELATAPDMGSGKIDEKVDADAVELLLEFVGSVPYPSTVMFDASAIASSVATS
jgi:hypothetical protein